MKIRNILTPIILAALSGCLQSVPPQYRAHHKFVESPQLYTPQKVLVMEVDVTIKEVTVGGVAEEVPAWSKQGSGNVREAMLKHFRTDKKKKIQLFEMPKLSDSELEDVKQHLALYRRVAGSIIDTTYTYSQQWWMHKVQKFDYTLGTGLKSLADRSGADSAIIILGEDHASTAGRKIAAFFLDSVSYGHSYLTAAIVNLKTGDVLWYNYAYQYKGADLREAADAQTLVDLLFEPYPGIEHYKTLKLVQQ
jgi:hypothetical protein